MLPPQVLKAVSILNMLADIAALMYRMFMSHMADTVNIIEHKEDLVVPVSTRKKADTTKFTQAHYDYIVSAHAEFLAYNKAADTCDKKTQQDLADVLNERLGLNKSVNSYGRVFRGKLDRSTLANGSQQDLFNT